LKLLKIRRILHDFFFDYASIFVESQQKKGSDPQNHLYFFRFSLLKLL